MLAFWGGFAPAQAAEVVSSNIVGYEKINLKTGFNMIGVQFVQVGGNNLDLGTVGTLNAEMPGYDEDGNYDTEMQVWNGNGYDYYGWAGDSGSKVDNDPDLDNKWLDMDNEEIDEIAAKGSGFWILAKQAGTLTISGEVPSSAVTIQLTTGFNMVANPFPGGVAVSDFGVLDSSFPGYDEDGDYDTEMQVWNGNGYDYYGWAGDSGSKVDNDPDLDNKWLDMDNELVDDVIPYGNAVWILTKRAGSITFTPPNSSN